jgi:hypothetical protein
MNESDLRKIYRKQNELIREQNQRLREENDDAGRKLANFGDYVEVVPDNKDLGEAPDDYVQFLVNKYCVSF